jgi:hypothetical protein
LSVIINVTKTNKKSELKSKKIKYKLVFECFRNFDQGKQDFNIISAFAEQRATAHLSHYAHLKALKIPNRMIE